MNAKRAFPCLVCGYATKERVGARAPICIGCQNWLRANLCTPKRPGHKVGPNPTGRKGQ